MCNTVTDRKRAALGWPSAGEFRSHSILFPVLRQTRREGQAGVSAEIIDTTDSPMKRLTRPGWLRNPWLAASAAAPARRNSRARRATGTHRHLLMRLRRLKTMPCRRTGQGESSVCAWSGGTARIRLIPTEATDPGAIHTRKSVRQGGRLLFTQIRSARVRAGQQPWSLAMVRVGGAVSPRRQVPWRLRAGGGICADSGSSSWHLDCSPTAAQLRSDYWIASAKA